MAVPFRQVQVEADRHQAARCDQRPGKRFTENRNMPSTGPDERRERRNKRRSAPSPGGGARANEQGEADAVAKEANDAYGNAVEEMGQAPRPSADGRGHRSGNGTFDHGDLERVDGAGDDRCGAGGAAR